MVARRYFNSDYEGVYVLESKFCKDLYYGDLLYSIEGIRVESGEDVEAVLSTYSVGDTVTLLVIRKGQQREVDLTLREYVPSDVGVRFPQ
jgi:PDZ domain-containing secreted protein